MSSDVANVYVGAVANDGTGDAIRTAFQTVNSNFYNLDNRISVGNIAVIYSTVGVTAQTFVSNSYSHTQTLEVYSTANIAGNAQINNLNVNNAFQATTITSTGNVNAIGGLTVTGPADFGNNVVIVGNLTVLGNTVNVNSSDMVVQDSIINLHSNADLSPLTVDDGKDIGIKFHFYKGGEDRHAALVWANDTQALEFYANGIETIANTFSGTYGNVKIGSLFVANTTESTSYTTGAIVSRGGFATAANAHVGGNLVVTGNTYLQSANLKQLSVSGTIVGPLYMTGADTIYINGSPVATSSTAFAGGTVPGYSLFQSVLEARGNIFANSQVTSTSTTTGALVVNGGVGISGNLYIGGGLSIPSIQGTVIGNATPALGSFTTLSASGVLYANSTVESSGTTSGAAVIKGGLGVGGNLYVGGSINNTSIGVYGAAVANFTTIGGTTQGSGAFTTLVTSSTIKANGNIVANSNTASTSTTTGALVVVGGVGISGNVYAGNNIYANAVYTDNVKFANGSSFVSTTIANTADITANVDGGTNVGLSLTTTGVVAASYGNVTYAPTFTVDSKGRITAAGVQQNYIALSGTSGTGSVNNQGTLTFAGGNGVTATVSSGTVTISTPQNLQSTANPTFANLTVGNLLPTGNAVSNIGDATHWFGTFYGVSTQAKYADLAEKYTSDTDYTSGTVLIFGGTHEVTVATEFADTRVAGAVTTNPAYLMNAELDGVAIALRGRIPVNVIGKVAKGDLLVTSTTPGCAVSVGRDKTHGAAVFAKALNNKDNDGIGQIEAVIL